MNRILLTICCLFCITAIHAQTTTTISSGTNIINTGATYNVPAGFFVNNGSYTDTTSPGAFNVNGGVAFSGTGTTTVYNFNFNGGFSVLNAVVTAYGTVTIGAGDSLDANNNLVLHNGASLVVNGYIVNNAIGLVTNATVASGGCPSFTSVLSTNVSGSVISYQWQSSPDSSSWTDVPAATSATFTPTVSATTYYRANITTTNSTFSESTSGVKLIFTGSAPAAITGTAIVCQGATTTLSDAISGGTWTSDNTGVATVGSSSGIVTGAGPGTATITYSTGCVPDVTLIVTVNAAPTITTSPAGVANICDGSSAVLTASGATTYTWAPNTALSATTGASVTTTTTSAITYTITGTGAAGCTNTATLAVNIVPLPTVVSTTGNMTCPGVPSTVSAVPSAGATINWYSLLIGGSLLGSGNTLPVTAASTTSYYAEAITGPSTLSTPFTGGNSQNGIMFDITTFNSFSVDGFDVSMQPGGTDNVFIYYRNGTMVGHDVSSAGWTLIGSYPGIPISATTTLTLPTPLSVTSGQTYGIYITRQSSFINYTNGTSVGTPIASNADLNILTGYGKSFSFGMTFSPRKANIAINYSTALATCVSASRVAATLTVNPDPAAILASDVCIGSSVLESDPTGLGTWSTASGNITIGATSGSVTGTSVGPASITYTLPTGCMATAAISVNSLPAAIGGSGFAVCEGSSITLTETSTGGTWSSSDNSKATVSAGGIVSGVSAGTSTITYTLPTGCFTTQVVTVNQAPTSILGTLSLCSGTTTTLGDATGTGTWTSGTPAVASIGLTTGFVTAGTTLSTSVITYTLPDGCATTAVVTVNGLPSGITGTTNVCTGLSTLLADATTGGTWSSDNLTLATVDAGGNVNGVAAGVLNITYTSPLGCVAATPFTVNATPVAITGTLTVCSGAATTLADASTGGTWSSSSTAIASVDAVSGIVTGGANPGGNATITYTLTGNCTATAIVTVNPVPGVISGPAAVCAGLSITLVDGTTGGAWASSNTSGATVTAGGSVTGVTAGAVTISYTLPGGCSVTYAITVNPLPAAISGPINVCSGSAITLTDAVTGGNWSSSSAAQASVGAGTGTVTGGTAPSTPTITYTLPTTCLVTTVIAVNPVPGPFNVTGTGSYCAGGTGVNVGLDGSAVGINYQLMLGGVAVGSPLPGTTLPLDFGAQTAGGTYTVTATDATTGCTGNMTGNAVITVNPVPTEFAVTGGGSYCTGGAGVLIGVSNSELGVSYQLFNGGPVGSAVSGTGGAFNFPPQTAVGTYTIVGTTGLGCTTTMGGIATVSITTPPTVYAVTGGGGYCAGGTGVLVGLAGSDVGVNYQLFNGGPVGSPVAGTGSAISFGLQSAIGTYTVVATNVSTSCTSNMSGSAAVSVNPLPGLFTVGGGGTYCTGGVTVTLSGSESGISYQIYNGGTPVGSPMIGAGTPLSFLAVTSAGTLTILATNTGTGCTAPMTGSATVVADPLPTVYNVTGGGAYCTGGTGTHIFLSFSNIGINYQLFNGASPAGAPLPGAASGLDFGAQTLIGTYTVVATNPATGCTSDMSGSATISTNPLPPVNIVTGGGAYCAGGTGVHIGLDGSATGYNYQLIYGASPSGLPVAGTGLALDFGSYTAAGSYIVSATNTATGCIDTMTGSATVTVNPIPAGITGITNTCPGSNITLSDATTGGAWNSSTLSVATVDPAGIVYGVAAGTSVITYTLPTGCLTTTIISVNSTPPAITGTMNLCLGATTTLADGTGGGTWVSSDPTVANITLSGGFVTTTGPGTTTITYTTGTGCSTTTILTVNSLPAAITGTPTVCTGLTTALADTGSGTWSSSNILVATVGASSGIVSGIIAGTSTISYNAVSGCSTSIVVTVSQTPAAITGPVNVCAASTINLNDATSGGTWASSDTTLATVGATGIVTGVSAGTPTIIYAMSSGCSAVYTISVNPLPAAIGGTASVCTGLTTALTEGTTGGTWSSSNISMATVDPVTGLVGGVATGTSTITYLLPTGCLITTIVTVNQTPAAITGSSTVCTGQTITLGDATSGGSWSSSNSAIATIGSSSGVVVAGIVTGPVSISYSMPSGCTVTRIITVNASPSAITGSPSVCTATTITLSDAITGGTWSSSNTTLAAVVSGTGVVSGIAIGTLNISYTLTYSAGSCIVTTPIVVNQTPPAVLGVGSVCTGFTISLSDGSAGGTWSSSDNTLATVDSMSGSVTGIATGNPSITYTIPATGCFTTRIETVNPTPMPITGTTTVCTGNTVLLSDATTGGSWSSNNTPLAVVGSVSGIVTGVAGGVPTISYIMPTGCFATTPVTVNNSPAAIVGSSNICLGLTTPLTDGTSGGTWSSNDNTIASVNSASGLVTGLSIGNTTITYTVPSGCTSILPVTVNAQPAAITGPGSICSGAVVTLGETTTGGTWTSSNTTFATVDPVLGSVTGLTPGALVISYTLPGGCSAIFPMTINPTPLAIAGANQVCVGSSLTLTDGTSGGTWSSSTAMATIGSLTGFVTGVSSGTTTISYTLPAGCTATLPMTVNGLPSAITGTRTLCANTTTTLNSTPGGAWSSSNTSIATVGSTGIVSGVTSGTAVITYTLPTSCSVTALVTVNALPIVFTVGGGGAYCAGGAGVHVTLSGSTSGFIYQLYNGTVAAGAPLTGTGGPLDFGLHVSAGTRVVVATNPATGCLDTMSGGAVIFVNPLPATYFVTGGGSYCAGSVGLPVGLFSSDTGVSYRLYVSGTPVSSAVTGTGSAITFGNQTLAGTYTVIATRIATACTNTMSGSVTITINPLPVIRNVTGGGTYCTGGTGVHIGLNGSDIGVNYQLFNGAVGGAIVAGTGSPIDFGLITAISSPSYTVVATNPATTCTATMLSSALVSATTPPLSFTISGGGAYCLGGTGVGITMSGSVSGVNYQLFIGATPVSGLFAGTGSGINFGLQTIPGIYTVIATDATTGCTSTMTGSATVTVNPLPTAFTVGGGGSFCSGGVGLAITLSGSSTGVNYQLVRGGVTLPGTISGSGSALTSPLQTTAGLYTIIATNTLTGCTNTMSGSTTISVNPLPNLYTVTGGGSYCAGDPGVHIGLSNSDITNTYQLYNTGVPVGSAVTGTGAALDFGLVTAAGTYTIIAKNIATLCTATMTGSPAVSITALPAVFNVTGGGSYCAGGTGLHVGLNGSTIGISYQLYDGIVPVGSPIVGAGSTIDFGLQTAGGTYTVIGTSSVVTSAGTHCSSTMTGAVTITVTPLPAINTVTGGGSYCAGGTGVHVGLNGSVSGNNYQLFRGTTAVGAAMGGTGLALDFGAQTVGGTYTVVATSILASCSSNMAGSALVTINPAPTAFTVTGGGGYCTGGTGVHVGLNGSTIGVSYQLSISGTPVGLPVAGTGSALDFGLETVPGIYTVTATSMSTTCTSNMSGSVSVSISTPPSIYIVTGGGSYCAGGAGADIGLSGSNTGISYQLFIGTIASGSPVTGTGSAIDFGFRTGAGSYTVVATDMTSTCTSNMAGSATVNVNPLPTVYSVTGGGSYCPGGTGVDVSMTGSDAGVSYQLFNGGAMIGAPVAGTGAAIDFGLELVAASPYVAVATNTATGCTTDMTGSATVSVYSLPNIYSVTGGGTYCAGTPGVDVSLSSSDLGINYQLYNGTSTVGVPVAGTGTNLDFGLVTAAGTYTVVAINASTSCTVNMTGSAGVSITPLPVVYNVTGGGGYCSGGSGADVGLSGSNTGINYQLYRGTSPIGSSLPGTGAALDFGLQNVVGTYTVKATNATIGCPSDMSGSAIVSINPLPTVYIMTGGGSFCVGGTGVHVGLSGSNMGIHYQLFNDTTAVGAPVAGTGTSLDFGVFTNAGTYTVVAANVATTCSSNMSGSSSVVVNPLPAVYVVTGSGSYCTGGSGVHVYLGSSDSGVNYQLFNGPSAVGSPVAGTGTGLDFGAITTAGNYTVVATNAGTGCTSNMADSAAISITALPTAYSVTGGGSYCAGGVGSLVSITGSSTGVNYQVYRGATPVGTPQAGTGLPLDLGFEAVAGTYTVVATNTITGCTNTMSGSATVSVNPVPVTYSVSGGGSYCAGGAGADIQLSGSNAGIYYQLYNGSATVGSLVGGSGSPVDFGFQTAAGTYTVVAINATTSCTTNMSGTAAVVISPLPVSYTVTGGGSYCAGGTGVAVALSGSDTGISYQLYDGASAIGTSVAGTGSAISFGPQTASGTYTVVATNATTSCTKTMAGSAIITVNSLPAVYAVIGGGSYCTGGTGYHVGLSGSNSGIQYQLYKDGSTLGSPVSGSGSALDFGLLTAAGTYTVTATNTTTGCIANMSGSASIAVYSLPTVYVVTGGGSYCAGGVGVHVGLSSSDSTVNYQLFNGTTPVGGTIPGTNHPIDFGVQTLAGTYTVTATNGITSCTSNMTGSALVTITPTVTPSVTISSSMGDTVCAGTPSNFTATIVNGGSSPAYTWYVNTTPVATTSSYSFTPTDGQVVSVIVTSSAICPSPATATSSVTISVLPNLTPSVTIDAAPGDTVCQGTMVTFTAMPVNGGTAPSYTWRLNGATVVGTGSAYSLTPVNGDVVVCLLGSNYRCRTDTIVLSNSIGMTVENTTPPTVAIVLKEGAVIGGIAYTDSLMAIVTNGGFAPTYQWAVNGVDVPGATTALFTPDSLFSNDVVSCTVINHNACGSLPASGQTIVTISNVGVKTVTSVSSDIRLVPNPNKGAFTLKGTLGTNSDQEVSIEVTDMLGQTVYKGKIMSHNGVIDEKVQLNNTVANGMYMLTLHSGFENVVFHMVIEQ